LRSSRGRARHSHQGQSGFTATPAASRGAAPRHHHFHPDAQIARRFFKKLDPRRIPPDKIEEAASLSRGDRWSEEVALANMPKLDAIVCGSVAVTRDGRRCGKGEGYSDLEFAILRELGHPPVPVATTVHDLQVVDSVPRGPTDQPLSVIATPTHTIRINRPAAAPTGIDWTRLSAEDLEEMPILAELKRMTTSNA
jgi:5-formyltetrahydrofolate cyclo-ligase